MACLLGIASWVTELLKLKLGTWLRLQQNRPHGKCRMTPLMYAAVGGHTGVVDQLLRNGAKVNSTDISGSTALHHAARFEQVEVTRILLKQGADAYARDRKGNSVLHFAAQVGNVMLMQQLLDHPIDSRLNGFRRESGYVLTPLHIAAARGDVDMMECLLGKGAEIDPRDLEEKTPLHAAARSWHTKGALFLLQRGASADVRCGMGETPLHNAAMSFDPSEALFGSLLTAGADVNARSNHGETPLHIAAANIWANEAMIGVHLRAGADISARTASGETPLHAAAETEELGEGILERLIREGADVDSLSDDGHSPLDLALGMELGMEPRIGFMHLKLRNACVLIAHGATVNTTDKTTLLHRAASMGYEQLVKVLLDHGFRSTISAPDATGVTPLHRAIIGSDITRDIDDDGSFASTDLRRFEREHPASITRLLLENGADIDAVDQCGDTALHYAIRCGRKKIVRMLLAFGADISIKARNGKTALQMARAAGKDKLAQLLVERGARDVD